MAGILSGLGIDPATLGGDGAGEDRLLILRHTLMNPYLIDHQNGISYIDLYLDHLGGRIRALLEGREPLRSPWTPSTLPPPTATSPPSAGGSGKR